MVKRSALSVLFVAVGIACTEPTPTPRQPWISGVWIVADSNDLTYAYSPVFAADDTVWYGAGDYRTLTVRLTLLATDTMLREVMGQATAYSGSSFPPPGGSYSTFHDTLDFADTIRVTASYIYGQYMTEPPYDSLPVPAAETSEIYWNADSGALCRSERAEVGSSPNLVPGSLACRLRVHWRRP